MVQGQETAHLHFARSSSDLGHRCDCHKVELEEVLPVSNEGWDANLQGGVDGGGCVCWPKMHTTPTMSEEPMSPHGVGP